MSNKLAASQHAQAHVCSSTPSAADAKRWNGVRTLEQARGLLKTLFRSASQHKAQASGIGRGRPAAWWRCQRILASAAWLGCWVPLSPCCRSCATQPHDICNNPNLQGIEASAQVTELSEEIELLKLRLDIAEAEKFEAAQQVASEYRPAASRLCCRCWPGSRGR